MKKILISVFFILLSLNLVAASNFNVEYLNLYLDNNSNTNKVSYYINKSQDLINSNFQLSLNYSKNLDSNFVIKQLCDKKLDFGDSIVFEKISCDVPKLGNGNYNFDLKISKNGTILFENKVNQYLFDNIKSNTKFVDLENNKTQVIINVDSSNRIDDSTGFIISSRIPKHVIKNLNNNNKNELITSSKKYVILKNDPLIAWNVEKIPTTINYTINKKINNEDKNKFSIEINKNSKSFLYVKYIVILIILLILIYTLKPVLFNKSKKN